MSALCGWCTEDLTSFSWSTIRTSWTCRRALKQQKQAKHASLENVLLNRWNLHWGENANLQMQNSWETLEITRRRICEQKYRIKPEMQNYIRAIKTERFSCDNHFLQEQLQKTFLSDILFMRTSMQKMYRLRD